MSLVYRSALASAEGGSAFGFKPPPENPGKKDNGGRRVKVFNILILDDEAIIRNFLEMAVRQLGHRAISATNGKDGMDLFEKGLYDLVVTDMSMPGLDGIGVLKAIREVDEEVAVILFSGNLEIDHDALRGMGANDFLKKPCTFEEILDTIERNLPKNS